MPQTILRITAQLFGLAAMVCGIASFQAKSRKSILLVQMSGSMLWCLQNLCLGGWSGVAVNVISVFRNWLYSKKESWRWVSRKIVPLAFMGAFLLAGIWILCLPGSTGALIPPFSGLPEAARQLINFFPTVSMLISSLSLYVSGENRIRILTLLSSPFFLVYNFAIGAYVGAFAEVFTILSILIALIRYRGKEAA